MKQNTYSEEHKETMQEEVTSYALNPDVMIPPSLREGELYHVFISYSSTDRDWTRLLIGQLEAHGLQLCYHERDFTPGRTVLENMADCIHQSQKVLLALSSEFVRSRWCLLEANMSLFSDCLARKPVVPVLLEPGVSVPLHLCHLTYLQAENPNFLSKLLKVLCTPSSQLRGSTVVPFQPPSVYNGKTLQPLNAVNEEVLHKWDAGQFSEMAIPDQLRLVVDDQEAYRNAVRTINHVSQRKVWLRPLWLRILIYFVGVAVCGTFIPLYLTLNSMMIDNWQKEVQCSRYFITIFGAMCFTLPVCILVNLILWKRDDEHYILGEMRKAVGQANLLLYKDNVLFGCQSTAKLFVVYVCLDGCKRVFAQTFREALCPDEMFQRALVFFSSGYACCLSKKHFPFAQPTNTGHVDEGGVCFCQYVTERLSRGEWA